MFLDYTKKNGFLIVRENDYFKQGEKTWGAILGFKTAFMYEKKIDYTFFKKDWNNKSILFKISSLEKGNCIRIVCKDINSYFLVLHIGETKIALKEIGKDEAVLRVKNPDTWKSDLQYKKDLNQLRIEINSYIKTLSDEEILSTKKKKVDLRKLPASEQLNILKECPLMFTKKNGYFDYREQADNSSLERIEILNENKKKDNREKRINKIFPNTQLLVDIMKEWSYRDSLNSGYYMVRIDTLGNYQKEVPPLALQNKYRFKNELWFATVCKKLNPESVEDFFNKVEEYRSENPFDYGEPQVFFTTRGVIEGGANTITMHIVKENKSKLIACISFEDKKVLHLQGKEPIEYSEWSELNE